MYCWLLWLCVLWPWTLSDLQCHTHQFCSLQKLVSLVFSLILFTYVGSVCFWRSLEGWLLSTNVSLTLVRRAQFPPWLRPLMNQPQVVSLKPIHIYETLNELNLAHWFGGLSSNGVKNSTNGYIKNIGAKFIMACEFRFFLQVDTIKGIIGRTQPVGSSLCHQHASWGHLFLSKSPMVSWKLVAAWHFTCFFVTWAFQHNSSKSTWSFIICVSRV